ncbi:hypothetical protein D0501_01540 [Leuconostoc holzapfelii]|uniref:Uncharacterized protein n=1 Tax=Leuconostoc holzapfelii TaxID=434464 RepID=A0ABT2NUB7_9LACO|nr:hypothetical protein [Leuconostoc holzapfelii]MCT8388788.1 hypothetical protein [Leuconostoc holzapfelii]
MPHKLIQQPGAVFGSALVILGFLGGLILLQNVVLNARLQTQRQMIRLAELDKLQFKASLHYEQTHQAVFTLDQRRISVCEDQLTIRIGKTGYTRSLYHPAP